MAGDTAATFAALRTILQRHARGLLVQIDEPGAYQLASPTLKDRAGRPLFLAAVRIDKRYVSYHFIPVYTDPTLLDGISPALRKRMQGKSCFSFTAIDEEQRRQLAALTRAGMAGVHRIRLPWEQGGKTARARAGAARTRGALRKS